MGIIPLLILIKKSTKLYCLLLKRLINHKTMRKDKIPLIHINLRELATLPLGMIYIVYPEAIHPVS